MRTCQPGRRAVHRPRRGVHLRGGADLARQL